jgi:hypothetical protein
MYRLVLKCILLIPMCLGFHTHILVENSGQNCILKIVSLSKMTSFLRGEEVFWILHWDHKFSGIAC